MQRFFTQFPALLTQDGLFFMIITSLLSKAIKSSSIDNGKNTPIAVNAMTLFSHVLIYSFGNSSALRSGLKCLHISGPYFIFDRWYHEHSNGCRRHGLDFSHFLITSFGNTSTLHLELNYILILGPYFIFDRWQRGHSSSYWRRTLDFPHLQMFQFTCNLKHNPNISCLSQVEPPLPLDDHLGGLEKASFKHILSDMSHGL